MPIPLRFTHLFWDTPIKHLSAAINARFVIERVLEYGDEEAWKWLKARYSTSQIVSVLKTSRRLSAKTANYFALLYNVPKSEVLCLRKPYTQKQNRF